MNVLHMAGVVCILCIRLCLYVILVETLTLSYLSNNNYILYE